MKFRTLLATPFALAILVLLLAQDTQQPKKIQRARRDVPCTVPAQVVGEKLADVKQVPKTDQPAQTAIEKHTVEKEKIIEIRYVKSADHDLNAHPVKALQFNSVPVAPGKSEIVTFGQTDLHTSGNIQVEAGTPHPLELSEGQQLLAAGQQVKMGNYNSPQPAIMFRVVKTESPLTVHYLNPYELAVTTNGLNTGANPFFYWKIGNEFVEAKPAYLIRSQDAFTAILPYKPDGTSPDLYMVGKHAYSATVPLPKFESGKNEVKWNVGEKTQALIFDAKTNSYKVSDGNSESVDPLTAVQLQSNSKVDFPVREVVFASITPSGTMFPNPMPFAMNYSEPSAPGASWAAGTLPALGMLGGGFLLYRAIDALTGKDSDPGTGTSQPPETGALAANPSTLGFNYTAGGTAPAPQSVEIVSQKIASLDFTAASTAAWLTLNPAQGRTPSTISVTASPAGLAPGIYTGAINIVSPSDLTVSPATVSVMLLVTNQSTGGNNAPGLLPPFVSLPQPSSAGNKLSGGKPHDSPNAKPDSGYQEFGSMKFGIREEPKIACPDLCAGECRCDSAPGRDGKCLCLDPDCKSHRGPQNGKWHYSFTIVQQWWKGISGSKLDIVEYKFANGQKIHEEDGWTFKINTYEIKPAKDAAGALDYKEEDMRRPIPNGDARIGVLCTQSFELIISGDWWFNPEACDGKTHKAQTLGHVNAKYRVDVVKSSSTTLDGRLSSARYEIDRTERRDAELKFSVGASADAKFCKGNAVPDPKILKRRKKPYYNWTPLDPNSDRPVVTGVTAANPVIMINLKDAEKYTPPETGAKIMRTDGTLQDTKQPVNLKADDILGVLVPIAGATYFITNRDSRGVDLPAGSPVVPAGVISPGTKVPPTNGIQPIAVLHDADKNIAVTSNGANRRVTPVGSVDGKTIYATDPGNPQVEGKDIQIVEKDPDGSEKKIAEVPMYKWVTEYNTLKTEKSAEANQVVQGMFKMEGTPPQEEQQIQLVMDKVLVLQTAEGLTNATVYTNEFGQTVISGTVHAGTNTVTVNVLATGNGGIQLVPIWFP